MICPLMSNRGAELLIDVMCGAASAKDARNAKDATKRAICQVKLLKLGEPEDAAENLK